MGAGHENQSPWHVRLTTGFDERLSLREDRVSNLERKAS
jgi:hypothetical protein